MTDQSPTIQSPCIMVCSIDFQTGYCFGCGRTGDEITHWIDYTPEERKTIMAQLDSRMKSIKRKPRRLTKRKRLNQVK